LALVDGLSLHPYNFAERAANTPEAAMAELDRIHALTVAAGAERPIYVTEMGYPAFSGRGGVAPETAAAYLSRFLLLASTRPYLAGVWWYCLRDQGTDPANKEHNFGVLDASWRVKPAAIALRETAAMLADAGRFEVLASGDEQRVAASRPDGSRLVLAWSASSASAPRRSGDSGVGHADAASSSGSR
jgi:hypothetical protein